MDNNAKKKMEQLIAGLKTTAELALIFFRGAIEAGAAPDEATRLTQAYIAAITFNNRRDEGEKNGHYN